MTRILFIQKLRDLRNSGTPPKRREHVSRDLIYRAEKPRPECRWGGGHPEVFAPLLHKQNASLYRPEKLLALASVEENCGISAVARQMRRLPGPSRGVACRDVLSATDVDANANDDDDFAALAARRTSKEKGGEDKSENNGSEKWKIRLGGMERH